MYKKRILGNPNKTPLIFEGYLSRINFHWDDKEKKGKPQSVNVSIGKSKYGKYKLSMHKFQHDWRDSLVVDKPYVFQINVYTDETGNTVYKELVRADEIVGREPTTGVKTTLYGKINRFHSVAYNGPSRVDLVEFIARPSSTSGEIYWCRVRDIDPSVRHIYTKDFWTVEIEVKQTPSTIFKEVWAEDDPNGYNLVAYELYEDIWKDIKDEKGNVQTTIDPDGTVVPMKEKYKAVKFQVVLELKPVLKAEEQLAESTIEQVIEEPKE